MSSAAPSHVRLVAYGRPATEAVAAAIRAAQQRHPLDPVTVVVSSNAAGLSVRRLIGGGTVGPGGLANVSFVTPFRLAELLAGASVPGYPLTNAVLAAAARQVLRDEPGPFAGVAEHHASEAALVGLYAELSHLRPATLDALAASGGRTAALVQLFVAVRRRLAGFHDEDDLARAAHERLVAGADAVALLGTFLWFLPGRLTPALSDLLGAALHTVGGTVIVGRTGDAGADDSVRRACVAAGVDLDGAAGADDERAAPTGTRIISVSDADEEVRAVCREIMALAEAGTPLDRIGVFHPSPDPYARTLHEHLQAAGIPHNGPSRLRLADRVAGRTLLAALDLPEQGWPRAGVLALVSGAPVRRGDGLAPSGAWDNVSRAAGVVGGLDNWAAALATFADDQRERATVEGHDPQGPAWRLDRYRADADQAEQLAAFVAELAALVTAVDEADGWAARVAASTALLLHLLGPEARRLRWPDDERAAGERVEAALARLELLDEIDPVPTTSRFRRAVEAELDEPAGRVGRFGEGVLFAPLATAPGLDLDAVFVVGMAEGTCPYRRLDDALLPDDVRATAGGELPGRDEALRDQHRFLLAALSAGRTQRILTFPRGDLRGRRRRLPSRWLLDTATALAGDRVRSSDFAATVAPGITEVASFVTGVEQATTAASLTERDLAALLRQPEGERADHPCVDDELRRGLTLATRRRSGEFTDCDGNLAGLPVPSPTTGKRLSATSLQTWAQCPFRYFLAQVLRLGDRPDPEAITTISAADRGSLIHEILERFVSEAISAPTGPPVPGDDWSEDDRRQLRAIADEVFAEFDDAGKTGRRLTWQIQRTLVLGDLDDWLVSDRKMRADLGSTPVAVELAFGLDGAAPLDLTLADGRRLAFRGRIDRVDATAGGHVVFDYKTGSGDTYKKLGEGDPVQEGTTLQLGLYAEAARARLGSAGVASYYWMASSKGEFKLHGYEWDDTRRARFLDVLETITDGIETGVFPGRPGEYGTFFGTHDNCRYCEFDRVCPRDRDDHERAKAGAPELALLERLRMPEADGGPGGGQGAGKAEGTGAAEVSA